jgi:hypothetical protein
MSRARLLLGVAGLGLLGAGSLLWVRYGETVWLEQIIAFCL